MLGRIRIIILFNILFKINFNLNYILINSDFSIIMDYLFQLLELLKIKNYTGNKNDNENGFKKPDKYKNINNSAVNL